MRTAARTAITDQRRGRRQARRLRLRPCALCIGSADRSGGGFDYVMMFPAFGNSCCELMTVLEGRLGLEDNFFAELRTAVDGGEAQIDGDAGNLISALLAKKAEPLHPAGFNAVPP